MPSLDEVKAWRPQRREVNWIQDNAASPSSSSCSSSKKKRNLDENNSSRHASFGAPPPYLYSIREAIKQEKETQRAKDEERASPSRKKKEVSLLSPLPAEQRSAALEASLLRLSRARAVLAAMPLVYDTPSRSRARALAEEAAREAEEDVKLLEGGRALSVVVSE